MDVCVHGILARAPTPKAYTLPRGERSNPVVADASRTFCILEAYATIRAGVKHGGRVQFATPPVPTLAPRTIACPRAVAVDARASSTRRPEDKALIDSYVSSTIGFEIIDATMTAAISKQLARQRVFAAARLTAYFGAVGLGLYLVNEVTIPLVANFPEWVGCGEQRGQIECLTAVNTIFVGLVGLGIVGGAWFVLSAAIYVLLERRPRVRYARAPLKRGGSEKQKAVGVVLQTV